MAVFAMAGMAFAQVRVEARPSFAYAAMTFPGYGDPDPASIQAFLAEMTRQGLMEKVRGPLFAVLTNSRLMAENRVPRWELGFRVDDATPMAAPLVRRHCAFESYAVIDHKGPFETVNVAWNMLVRTLEVENRTVIGPPIQTWFGNPETDAPEALRTEIAVPIAKAAKNATGGRP